MRHSLLALALLAVLVAGCGKSGPTDAEAAAGPVRLQLAPEDLLTVTAGSMIQGPVISGSIVPERRADMRAEVGGVITGVRKDNGQTVAAGDLLMTIDATALRDRLTSAQEAARAAARAAEQAQRQVERQQTLRAQGMTSMQALEDAQLKRTNAASETAAAQAQVVVARQQLDRTTVQAPFAGIVAGRQVSVGDTVQVGRELVKVIDPSSMRFEGLVSADRMGELTLGQPVRFRINGVPGREFSGKVTRIDPAVNAATRQVALVVDFDDRAAAPRISGLFAEGTIAARSVPVLSLPESAIVRSTTQGTAAWRVADGELSRVTIALGERDPRTGLLPVTSGLAAGDRVLRHPRSTLVDGQPVEFIAAPPPPGSAAAG